MGKEKKILKSELTSIIKVLSLVLRTLVGYRFFQRSYLNLGVIVASFNFKPFWLSNYPIQVFP